MMKELIEEAESWELAPKPASLWWSGRGQGRHDDQDKKGAEQVSL